jgi:hypothetical protein
MLVEKFPGDIVMTAPSGSFDSSSLSATAGRSESFRMTVLNGVLFPQQFPAALFSHAINAQLRLSFSP